MKLKNNISIDTLLKEYEDKDVFNDAQLCNIKLGLMFGDDVEIYAKPEFTYKQMDAIASGLVDWSTISTLRNTQTVDIHIFKC